MKTRLESHPCEIRHDGVDICGGTEAQSAFTQAIYPDKSSL